MNPPATPSKPPNGTSVPLRDWVEDRFKNVWHELNEVRGMAQKAGEQTPCRQEKEIEKLIGAVEGWRNVKLAAVVVLIGCVSGALLQFYSLKAQADTTENTVKQVQVSVKRIENDVADVTTAVADWENERERERAASAVHRAEQNEALRKLIKETLREARIDIEPRRRNR